MIVHERRDDFAAAGAVVCGKVRLQQKVSVQGSINTAVICWEA